jgi:hypothetical protein
MLLRRMYRHLVSRRRRTGSLQSDQSQQRRQSELERTVVPAEVCTRRLGHVYCLIMIEKYDDDGQLSSPLLFCTACAAPAAFELSEALQH